MKLYWQSANVKHVPPNAHFQWIAFSNRSPLAPLQESLKRELLPSLPLPIGVSTIAFSPEKSAWIPLIEKTVKAISQGDFSKTVLARVCVIKSLETIDPFSVAKYLEQNAQNSTIFCIANRDIAFVGASPERLFYRSQRTITSDIIAGTAPRGKTEKEDLFLEQKLLNDQKAKREWQKVADFLEEKFARLCSSFTLSSVRIKKTTHVQHLAGTIQGTLLPGIQDVDIVQALHPTPALCGSPSHKALEWILEHEPFPRELYGGAIGWGTEEEAEWIVAIRMCKIEDKTISLYTGAGIVEGSDPHEEWEELNHKMALYQNLFQKAF